MPDWILEAPGEGGYDDEIVRSIYLGNLFQFFRGRNAWYGSWSSNYFGQYSFHPDFEEIERRVEANRTPGSTWSIVELPAIVFAGSTHALVAVEINTTRPFASVAIQSLKAPTLAGFAEMLLPLKCDAIWRFFTTKGRVKPTRLPFYRYASVSAGGNYTLGWNHAKQAYDLNRVQSLIDAAKRRLRQSARAARSKAIDD